MALQPTASGIVEYVADVVTAELQPLIDGAGTALANIDAAKVAAVGVVGAEGTTQIAAVDSAGAIQTANAAAQVVLAETAATTAANLVGTINPADFLDIEAGLVITKAPSFRSSANRLKRIGQCAWAKTTLNEPRIYVNNSGAIEGVLFDGAETIKSADFYTAPVDSSSAQWCSSTGGTGAVIQQVGGHSSPDIAGGTGKLSRVYGGTGANVEARFANLSQSVVSTDVMRIAFLISFDNPASQQTVTFFPRAASGTGLSGNITLTVATDGTVTMTATSTRGIDLFDTDASGRKWYRVWSNYTSSGTGVYYPAISIPAGVYANLMAWTVKNPTQAVPSVVPVMADASFIADSIVLGTTTQLEVEWKSLAVGRTSISDATLTPPRMAHTPVMPLERRIVVKRATEITARAYFLPSARLGRNFVAGMSDYIGPGYYDVNFAPSSGTTTLRSAYTDPKRWGIVRRVRIISTASASIDRVAFWLRTPYGNVTGSSADSQVILEVNVDPDNVTIGDALVVGSTAEWSQYFTPATQEPQPYFVGRNLGRFYVNPGASSGTLTIGRLKTKRTGNAGFSVNVAADQTLNINATGLASDLATGDMMQLGGTGTLNLTLGHHVNGAFEAAPANFWQTAYEIEVDTGSGYVALSSSGLTVSQLPVQRRFTQYGTHEAGVITAAPHPERLFWVTSWAYGSGLGATIDKAGFQYRGPNMLYRDATTDADLYRTGAIPDGSVWVSDDVGTPSSTNPRIRIRHTSVKWTSASVNTPQSGPLSAGAGTHGDNFQITSALTWSYDCQNVVWTGEGGQGYFTPGSATCTAFSARGIFGQNTVNAFGVTGTSTVAGLMAATYSADRDFNGKQYMPKPNVLAGSTLNLSGLYISTNSDAPTGMGTITGTLASSPIPVGTARLNSNTLITSTVDQPGLANYLEYFIPASSLKDGKLNATPSTLKVTGYALEKMPYLKSNLEAIRLGAWGMFAELEAICTLGSPTHFTSIANTAGVGTILTLTVRDPVGSTTIKGKVISEGDPLGLFTLDNGVLKTAALLKDAYAAAIVDNLALVTDVGERISVMVTA